MQRVTGGGGEGGGGEWGEDLGSCTFNNIMMCSAALAPAAGSASRSKNMTRLRPSGYSSRMRGGPAAPAWRLLEDNVQAMGTKEHPLQKQWQSLGGGCCGAMSRYRVVSDGRSFLGGLKTAQLCTEIRFKSFQQKSKMWSVCVRR